MQQNTQAINSFVDAVFPSYCVIAFVLSFAIKPKEDEHFEERIEDDLLGENEKAPPGRPNLSGTWRMIPNDEYTLYLEAVRIRPLARRALARIPVLQTIRLHGEHCEITTKTLLSFTTACRVGGPATKSKIKNDHFQDRMFWEESSNMNGNTAALVLIKDNLTKGYVVTTKRSLADPNTLRADIHIHTHDGSKPDAHFVQLFQRTSSLS